ncbi:MAG: HEAT repeat domain-containing protein [Methylococcaceae bacterium]|nr:HEAT repeat domain-containing protein [Methylococcaceae bacterium]MDP3903456.1 HEAT repeat domain-containing protein [Methylococcaceae bacterium]
MKIFTGICLFLVTAIIASHLYLSGYFSKPIPPELVPPVAEIPKQLAPEAPPKQLDTPAPQPNLQALSSGLNAKKEPEAEMEAEPIVERQIRSAQKELKSADIGTRVDAIDQLAAYPTKASEQLLVSTMQANNNEEIRISAADALSSVRHPNKATVSALIVAASANNYELRDAALMTLDIYINREPYGSKRTKTILQDLRGTLKRKQLSSIAREDIADFISEHTL